MSNELIRTGITKYFSHDTKPSLLSQNGTSVKTGGYSQNLAFSPEAAQIFNQINELQNKSGSIACPKDRFKEIRNRSIDEVLFDACADAKILTSRVSMHLPSELRESLFEQIDLIHDSEDWDQDDSPVKKASFQTFLRWLVLATPSNLPGLGLSSAGNIIAAWIDDNDRLILEFLANDSVKWIVSRHLEEDIERGTGQTNILRLAMILSPYNPNTFFHKGG